GDVARTVGRISRAPSRAQAALRVRGDAAHVGGDGAHRYAASAGRARAPRALPAQAPGARGAHPEEGARGLPQSHAGDALAPQAEARKRLSSQETSGQKRSASARPVMVPTRPLEKNTLISPCDTSIAWR